MRLLNTTDLTFRNFLGGDIKPYAILSHCWSHVPGEEEPTHQQVVAREFDVGSYGWKKVTRCCEIAQARGLHWAWIDTICIDKTSSAELSEAINSMYAWYEQSAECYVFLDNVTGCDENADQLTSSGTDRYAQAFRDNRWFTRGWTLQELLAPSSVFFYDEHGLYMGSRSELASEIAHATGIQSDYILKKQPLANASVAQRMCWASKRQTT